MKKRVYLFGLVFSILMLGLVEAVSGFILWFALPSGSGKRGLESIFLGITRHTWIDIHDWVAIALIVIIIIHILVHWKWVVHMTKETWNHLIGPFRIEKQTMVKIPNSSSVIQ